MHGQQNVKIKYCLTVILTKTYHESSLYLKCIHKINSVRKV